MSDNRETLAEIVAEMRIFRCRDLSTGKLEVCNAIANYFADRIEAARRREHKLLRLCARWIYSHDIYRHMSKELLTKCKEVLGDDGQFTEYEMQKPAPVGNSAAMREARWQLGHEYEYAYCSNCGHQQYVGWETRADAKAMVGEFHNVYKFCPNCGAKMEVNESEVQ